MTTALFLIAFAYAETTTEESARLLVERKVFLDRVSEIDKRLTELGVTVPSAAPVPAEAAYQPAFKAIIVSSSNVGSDKVAKSLRSRQQEFTACWARAEHVTGVSFSVREDGRIAHDPPPHLWQAAMSQAHGESRYVEDCYKGVLQTIWDFPPAPIKKIDGEPVYGESTYVDPYYVEFLFG